MRNNAKKEKLYAVIGLGRFGFSLAKRLAEAGKDLIVIDRKETVIYDAVTFMDNAYMMTDLSMENLRYVGIPAAQLMTEQDLCLEEFLGVAYDGQKDGISNGAGWANTGR